MNAMKMVRRTKRTGKRMMRKKKNMKLMRMTRKQKRKMMSKTGKITKQLYSVIEITLLTYCSHIYLPDSKSCRDRSMRLYRLRRDCTSIVAQFTI